MNYNVQPYFYAEKTYRLQWTRIKLQLILSVLLERLRFNTCTGTRTYVITTRTRTGFYNLSVEIS